MADQSDSSGIPLIGPVIDLLTSIFSNRQQVNDLAQQTEQVEERTWQNSINVAGWAYGAFGGLGDALKGAIGAIGHALEHLFKDLIFGHLLTLLKAIRDFIEHLRKLIAPLVKTLQAIQKAQRQYQLQTLRRVVNLIQRIRRILLPFRLLHLKFAQKLDRWLGSVEGKLITGTFAIARKTNEIVGWVNVLFDPTGIMRGWPLGTALGRDMAALAAAAAALDLKTWFPKQLAQVWTPAAATPAKPQRQI